MAGLGHRLSFTDQQLIELHKKGMIDREIAEKLDVSKNRVYHRRRKLGLEAHDRKRLFTDQQLVELHEKGLNDREIGKKLGAYKSIVGVRRRRLGLKAHGRRRLFTDQQLIDLYERRLNDREIGEKLGADQSTVNYRRRKLGLESKYRLLFTDQSARDERYRVGFKLNQIYVDALDHLVEEGLYLNRGEIMRDALRILFRQHSNESHTMAVRARSLS